MLVRMSPLPEETAPPSPPQFRRRMSPLNEELRLRRLLDKFLKPFSDIAGDRLTEEIERGLLIALSGVFRQVKQWIRDFDFDSNSDSEEVCIDFLVSQCDDKDAVSRRCWQVLTRNIANAQISRLHIWLRSLVNCLQVFLLAVNSRPAQHLVGSILVAISELLLKSGNNFGTADWNAFIYFVCLSLEVSVSNTLVPYSEFKTRYYSVGEPSRSLLNSKLKSANWSMVAAIFKVLRNIQKYLNQKSYHTLTKAYIDSVSSLMLNIPWDTLREIYVGYNIDSDALQGSSKDAFLNSKEVTIVFGNFIQFLCYLVPQGGFLIDNGIHCKIINLVPKLATWCLLNLQSHHNIRMACYLRHKLLVLMVKLSSSCHIKQTNRVTWMDIIHKYFADQLFEPISGIRDLLFEPISVSMVETDRDDFLEDSPFFTSIFHPGTQNVFSHHLQRLTVFLFFKFFLWSFEPNLGSEFPSESKGFMMFHVWLRIQETGVLAKGLYFDGCVRFTISFLRLFMREDDILFKMLLQLLRVPFYPERRIPKYDPWPGTKNRLAFLASDLFNPIHLFHLFLAEIHYDHQVLLDYLISKDTGSSSAEYLLRSLRIICDSWSLFVDFPGVKEDYSGQLSPKRQKVFKEHAHKNYRLPFASASECLDSLKNSIDSLNQKNMCPYYLQSLTQW